MSFIPRRSLRIAAALPVVAALMLSGCSADKSATGSEPQSATSSSTTASSKPTTAAPKPSYLSAGNFAPALKQATAKHTTAKTTMRMVVGGKTGTMTAVTRLTKPLAMDSTMQGEIFGGNGRMILIGKTLYFSMAGATPAGKYLKLDLTQTGDPNVARLAKMLESADPTKTFDNFRSGVTDVRHIGSDVVDGVKTERYNVTVDVAKVLKAQGQKVPAGTPKTITYTMWMDQQNLPRRMSFNLSGVSMTMTMSDWGKPVTIKPPPASAIVSR